MKSTPTKHGSVRLQICGAARTVTGSKYLLESDSGRVLVDCGLFQGKKELRLKNWEPPPFAPESIDAVVLTHAHIDHTGYLPLLVRRGFKGPIYCTEATKELLGLLLPDSAFLQEEEARYANKHGTSKHTPAKPLYTEEDARRTLKQLVTFPHGQFTPVIPGVRVQAAAVGHILGAASLTFELHGRRLTFSGDIGRYGAVLLPDPEGVALGDVLLTESTYGDKVHAAADLSTELEQVVRAAAETKGPLLIPAFAIGRTQTLLYHLAELERTGRIPVLPVYVDSPMAVDATRIYRRFPEEYDSVTRALLEAQHSPLLTQNTNFCSSREESKALNGVRGARIIISASGMATGGRILHHLMHLLPEETTTVLFVGYQAEGTRGRLLQAGAGEIKLFGRHVPVRAKIANLSGLSAHGDRNELLRWLESCSGTPRIVRTVHGEPEPATAFAGELRSRFGWDAKPAEPFEWIEV